MGERQLGLTSGNAVSLLSGGGSAAVPDGHQLTRPGATHFRRVVKRPS
jgi:hypothetical protein